MRAVLPLLAACTHAEPVAPRPVTDFVRDTHALLEAFDRGDVSAVAAATAPTFVRFESGKVHDRASELARLKAHPPEMTRTWKDEHVYVRPNDATFIGLAIEHELGNDSHGNREYDGWYTVSWTRDGSEWKVAHWSWQPYRTTLDSARDFWNDNFRQDIGFTHEPNQLLASAITGVAPGAALDVGTGQGRNALYLAAHGWTVTAIDISDEGLRRAREAAVRQHLALDAVQADADSYDYGVAKWDLVTMIYAGDTAERVEKIARSIKPGGLFVFEFFVDDGNGGIEPGLLAKVFADGFEIVRDDVVTDRPDWGLDRAKLERFVARKR